MMGLVSFWRRHPPRISLFLCVNKEEAVGGHSEKGKASPEPCMLAP